jgi:predicted Fe-Mo cluster-binding NifX family protein
MGAANSQPQGVQFNVNTGRVAYMDKNSSVTEWVPNDTLQDLNQYISFVQQYMKEGQAVSKDYPRSVGSINIVKAAGTAEAVAAGADLPRLQAWQIKEPAARAVVYTDAGGASRFLYVNDPAKIIELSPGGSRIQQVAVKAVVAQEKVMAVQDAGQQKMQCLAESVISVATMDQRKQIEDAMKACMAKFETQKSAEAPAPAPAMGTSTYASQGVVYPIEVGGGYPMWVIILSIAAIVAALLVAKKSG